MNVTCDVIRDLLPLYHDDIGSPDSRALVEEHLTGCEACRAELSAMNAEMTIPHPAPEAEAMQKLNKAWKKVKRISFGKCLIAVALVLTFSLITFFSLYSIPAMEGGNSMSPVIEQGERCLVNKYDRNFSYGDIVCIPLSAYNNLKDMVWIVGRPGDTVEIIEGTLYINGAACSLFKPGTIEPRDFGGCMTLDWDEYFVMGINHENAVDSRDEWYGTVSDADILGKVQYIFKLPTLSFHQQVEAVALQIE